MLEDYRKYLYGIRNNLIQCGVEFPISSVDGYKGLYELSCRLDSLLWYYSVLEISGSEDRLIGFFLPLNIHYKTIMRNIFYSEFRNYIQEYNSINVRSYIRNPKYSVKNVESSKKVEELYSNHTEDLVKLSEIGIPDTCYVGYGRYVEDWEDDSNREIEDNKENITEDLEYSDSGRYVEDWGIDREVTEDVEYVSYGRYVDEVGDLVDDLIEEDVIEESDFLEEDLVEEEEEVLFEEDLIEESDLIEEDSDLLEEEEDDESDLLEVEDSDLIEDNSDDFIEEEEEDGESDLLEVEDSDLIEDDSDLIEEESDWIVDNSDLVEENDDSDLIEEEESDLVEEDSDDFIEEPKVQVEKNILQNPVCVENTPDLSDQITDFVEGCATALKKVGIKVVRALEK